MKLFISTLKSDYMHKKTHNSKINTFFVLLSIYNIYLSEYILLRCQSIYIRNHENKTNISTEDYLILKVKKNVSIINMATNKLTRKTLEYCLQFHIKT